MLNSVKLKKVVPGAVIQLGSFKIEFIRSTHSIADSVALAIHTQVGVIVHTSDFKIDHTPIEGQPMDLARLAELGRNGVLLLMCDSTNVEREGSTMWERLLKKFSEKQRAGFWWLLLLQTFIGFNKLLMLP
jgi:ribonuclease J